MKFFGVGVLLVVALGAVWSAAVPFQFDCSKEAGFVMDPNQHLRVGYVTDFNGLGLTLQKDLQVNLPFKPIYPQIVATPGANGVPAIAKLVGVIEKFEWNGGVSDPISIDFYVSQQNATLLKTLTNSAIKNTSISAIGWWIGDYDQETHAWFEEAKPLSPQVLKAMIQGSSPPPVYVDLTPVKVKEGIDVNVYKVSLRILPQAHSASMLSFVNSPGKSAIKAWGTP